MISSHSRQAPWVSSILVIHQGALGDFILSLPSLKALRKSFPHARIVMMGYPRILELVEKRYYADQILSVDQKGMATFFVRDGPLDLTLSQFFKTFDLIVVFGKDGEGTVTANLRRVCQGDLFPIHSLPLWNEKVHLADHLLKQFAQFGIFNSELNPKLHLNNSDREWARNFWGPKGIPPKERSTVVILHPGSGSKKKVWPLDRFLNLKFTIQERLNANVLVVLGPAEGAEVEKAFEGKGRHPVIIVKGLTLVQLASVMEGSWFFIGNDSGISHLAAALGLPTIAIFGPSDPQTWSPRGEKVVVVQSGRSCSPCPSEQFFQCQDFECLRAIEIEEVLIGIRGIGIDIQF